MLRAAIEAGSADASYALATWYLFGKKPYINPNRREAVRLLRLAATAGNVDAMFDLGVCYERGAGVAANEKRAFDYYLMAAIRGDAKAIFEAARCLFWGVGVAKDRRIARIYLDRAKELGSEELE